MAMWQGFMDESSPSLVLVIWSYQALTTMFMSMSIVRTLIENDDVPGVGVRVESDHIVVAVDREVRLPV